MKTKATLNGWLLFGALLALQFSTACPHTAVVGKPVWAVTHQHLKFTPDKFIIGVGFAPSAHKATQAAKRQLSDVLRTQLASELQLRSSKLSIAGSPTLAPSSAAQLLSSLPQIREVLTWSDRSKTRYYSMVVMNRTELLQSTKSQIQEWEMQSMELTGKASTSASQSPYSALLNLMAATLLRCQAEQQRALLAVVSKAPPPAQKGPSLTDLVGRIEDLLGRVKITAAHGKHLCVNAKAKQVTLVLSADLKAEQTSVPFSGCPIVFESSDSRFLPAQRTRVDPAGMATASVNDLAQHAGQEITIKGHIDGAAVLQDSGVDMDDTRFAGLKKMLDRKTSTFHLSITAQKAQKIAIAIAETRGGKLRQHSLVVNLLQRMLVDKGYNVLPLDELDLQLPANPTPESMAKTFQGKANLLIYGVAASTIERKVSKGLVFVKATGQLVVLEVSTAKVLMQQTLSVKSPGMDLASASDRAFGSLARKFSAALSKQGSIDR